MITDIKRRNVFGIIAFLMLLIPIMCMTGCGTISDGEYTASVVLTGGSGRAYIESPCRVTVKNGKAEADIVWSSPSYDYMIVGGQTFLPVNTEGNSEFVIPVELDSDMEVQADTVAMSTPHLIDYTIRISLDESGDSGEDESKASGKEKNEDSAIGAGAENKSADLSAPDIPGLEFVSTDDNIFAECFAIHRYADDYAVISVSDGRNYLVVPEGRNVDEDVASCNTQDFVILRKPLDKIYLAASGVMCHFDAIGAIGSVALSGLEKDDWLIDSARTAMDEGTLQYGGKYSAPDYEKMVMEDISLAIENTMILHVPKVQEKLEKIGIPVFIDRASYESEPLGRCEWIKVYGLMTGKETEAAIAFEEQQKLVMSLGVNTASGKSVAIFSVNSNHQIVTRKKNDYFSKMVNMARGEYLPPDAEDDENAGSQVTISMEAFYDYASDADILIYNGAINDAPGSYEELSGLDKLFEDFAAFKEEKIWYTDKSLYQFADKSGTIIDNLNRVITKGAEETEFFHKLKKD